MSGGRAWFYAGGGRREAIDRLFDGVHRTEAVLLLVGAAGSGRSAVLDRFIAEADPGVLAIATIHGDVLMSADQALWALAGQLDNNNSRGDASDALHAAVARCRGEGRNVALLVDDAHELGEEPRNVIVHAAREAGVGLVLAGDESLAPAMDPEVPFEVLTLRPLTEDETEEFVAGWLAVEDEDELPSHRTISRLHRHSAGMPGRLAGLVGGGDISRAPLLPNGIPVWHALFTLVAVALLGWLLARIASTPEVPSSPPGAEVAITLPPVAAVPAAGAPVASPVDASARVAAVAVPQPLDVRQPVGYIPPAGMPAAPAGPNDAEAVPVAASAAPASLAPRSQATPAVPPPAPAAVHSPGSRLNASPVRAAQPGTVQARFSVDEQALLAMKPGVFTLQLFGSFNEAAVRQFIAAHPGLRAPRLFRSVREELPWHVVVTGEFRSRDEARAYVLALPEDIQNLKPWTRTVGGIQDELRRRGD